MSKLLALDLSTQVGHAIMVRGRVPLFGTLNLEEAGPDRAKRLGMFLTWVEDVHAVHRFDGICWERPLLVPTDKVDKLETLYGLVGIAYGLAGKFNLPWREVSVDDAKAELCGSLTKMVGEKRKKMDKDDMLYHARRTMNWPVTTHHEADAGAVGLVAYSRLFPKRAA